MPLNYQLKAYQSWTDTHLLFIKMKSFLTTLYLTDKTVPWEPNRLLSRLLFRRWKIFIKLFHHEILPQVNSENITLFHSNTTFMPDCPAQEHFGSAGSGILPAACLFLLLCLHPAWPQTDHWWCLQRPEWLKLQPFKLETSFYLPKTLTIIRLASHLEDKQILTTVYQARTQYTIKIKTNPLEPTWFILTLNGTWNMVCLHICFQWQAGFSLTNVLAAWQLSSTWSWFSTCPSINTNNLKHFPFHCDVFWRHEAFPPLSSWLGAFTHGPWSF